MFKLNPEVIICSHHDVILDDEDAYYIQCSDGCGDVCRKCIETYDELIYIPDALDGIDGLEYDEDGAVHPYDEYISEWVFLGTVEALKKLVK